jgi:hypothetical protein
MPGHDMATDEKDDPLATAIGSFGYGTRDILCQLTFQPDKAATRTSHGPDKPGWGLGGDEFVFRLLKPLRGKLVKTVSGDEPIWSVASINQAGQLVVVLYNDSKQARSVRTALPGAHAWTASDVRVAWVQVDRQGRKLQLIEQTRKPERWQADGAGALAVVQTELPARSAVRLIVPLASAAEMGHVRRTQHFSPDVLLRVNPDEIVTQRIEVPEPDDPAIEAAWVRLALGGRDHPGSQIRIDDGPWIPIAERPGIHRFPIDADAMGPTVKVTIKSGREKADAFYVHATSVVVDRRQR